MDIVRNEEVHRRVVIEGDLVGIVHQIVLRWFRQMERMDEKCLSRGGLMAEASGGWS